MSEFPGKGLWMVFFAIFASSITVAEKGSVFLSHETLERRTLILFFLDCP